MTRKAMVAVVLMLVGSMIVCVGAYTRDISGDLRKDSATGIQACLVALEALIDQSEEPAVKVPTFLAAKIIGTPGTPIVLAADGTYFTVAVLQAGTATGANTSPITIGGNTAYTSQVATQLAPGDTWELRPPAGTKWDLNDFYIDGVTTTDGVRIMYVAP